MTSSAPISRQFLPMCRNRTGPGIRSAMPAAQKLPTRLAAAGSVHYLYTMTSDSGRSRSYITTMNELFKLSLSLHFPKGLNGNAAIFLSCLTMKCLHKTPPPGPPRPIRLISFKSPTKALELQPRTSDIDSVPGVSESVVLELDPRLVPRRLAVALDDHAVKTGVTADEAQVTGSGVTWWGQGVIGGAGAERGMGGKVR